MTNFDRVAKLRAIRGVKLAITGSRGFTRAQVADVVRAHWDTVVAQTGAVKRIITGDWSKVDATAVALATELTGKPAVQLRRVLPVAAGGVELLHILLAQEATALLLIWDGRDPRCRDLLAITEARLKPVIEIEL